MSVPNQKLILIQKQKYESRFLQIGIEEWQNAGKDLNYSEFKLYLYLASNKDGFPLELSQKAVENATGIKKSSYHDAFKKLLKRGYISSVHGNKYYFFTTPVRQSGMPPVPSNFDAIPTAPVRSNGAPPQRPEKDTKCFEIENRPDGLTPPPEQTKKSAKPDAEVRPGNREIDNINNTNKDIDRSLIPQKEGEQKENNENDKYRELLSGRASTLSDSRRSEFAKISRNLIAKGKSPRWIWTAFSYKANKLWEVKGFGLLFKPDYQEQINEMIEKEDRKAAQLKAKQQQIAKDIGEQLRMKPEIIHVKRLEEKGNRKEISLEDALAGKFLEK
ncbi:helix-turn-helix domain-containing protein [Christensenellaceae bacterium OttesenSCG-928-K19]|nr:helix-turn-helix domain-containing protein [Christensenellaceae bacterium OttesenSCG-928-K19]